VDNKHQRPSAGSECEAFEMVQTYGIAREDDTEPREDIRDGEATALLGGTSATKDRQDGHASITSCVSNLSNTIIGSGPYALPYRSLKKIITSDVAGMLTFPLV
jgi:hypothetical protein